MTGKFLWGIEKTLYLDMGGEYMHLHRSGKNWIVRALNRIYLIPLF